VLLTFDNGSHVVLPAIGEFIGGLRFDEDELVDVSYEPALYTRLRPAYESRLQHLRQLRAVVSSSTRLGVFHLDDQATADALARQMQVEKGLDPSLALYATYAYHDLGRSRDRLHTMREYLGLEPGVVWFDLAMLTSDRAFPTRSLLTGEPILITPFYPALSQGWALATALEAGDQAVLARLRPELIPSPWALFSPRAYADLRNAMMTVEAQ
jgi:hypothetical protein